jgi:hypothetical protein
VVGAAVTCTGGGLPGAEATGAGLVAPGDAVPAEPVVDVVGVGTCRTGTADVQAATADIVARLSAATAVRRWRWRTFMTGLLHFWRFTLLVLATPRFVRWNSQVAIRRGF